MPHDPLVLPPVETPGAGAEARTPLRRFSLRRIPIGGWLFFALLVAALVAGTAPGNPQTNQYAPSVQVSSFKASGDAGQPVACAGNLGPASTLIQEFRIEKNALMPIQQMPAVSPAVLRARYRHGAGPLLCDALLFKGMSVNRCLPFQVFLVQAPWPADLVQPEYSKMLVCLPARLDVQGGSSALVPGLDPASILTNLWTTGVGGLIDFVKTQFIDWASSFGFVSITPAALSYKLLTIKNASAWSIGVVDGAIALILVIGGYQVIMRHHLGLPTGWVMEQLSHLALTAIIANVGFFSVLPQLIELNNSLCISLWMAFGHAGVGDFSLPLGVVNWVRQPFTIGLFVVIDFVLSLLLVIVQLVRLGLLDVLIVFAPLGIICAALPHTRAFFRLWVIGFFCTLFVQVLQVGAIALGSALIVSFGTASTTPIIILVGIATTYIAFRLPHMLLSGALRTSVGSIGRDVSTAVTGIVNLIGFSRV
jgi:hypothetical protein